jgi:hypothetical protein
VLSSDVSTSCKFKQGVSGRAEEYTVPEFSIKFKLCVIKFSVGLLS